MFKEFLTTEGERLLAKSIAGTATLTITKMEIGDGDRGTSTKAITSLANPRMTLDIYSVILTGDNNIEITTILDSSAITEGFYFREKGIYATDGTTEILFMYGTTGSLADWLENVSSAVLTKTIRTIVTLSASDNISITLQKGLYASREDVEEILTTIKSIELDGDWATQNQAESILSILDTFVAAYTTLRAGKLDNLDALISSRAPANTALSNATWTNARAGYLDYLANTTYGLPAIKAYVDTLETVLGTAANTGGTASAGTVMAKLNALIGLMTNATGTTSCVKRIVRGVVAATGVNHIVVNIGYTVNPSKVFILLNSDRSAGYSSSPQTATPFLVSVTATQFTIGPAWMQNETNEVRNVSWQLIEFY